MAGLGVVVRCASAYCGTIGSTSGRRIWYVAPAIATSGLTVRFGGVTAVDHVSLTIERDRLTGIIGPNGAGKTTFIDAVSGLVRSTGDISLGDVGVISRWAPYRRAQAGIGRTFQGLELFDEFTVEENLL